VPLEGTRTSVSWLCMGRGRVTDSWLKGTSFRDQGRFFLIQGALRRSALVRFRRPGYKAREPTGYGSPYLE
jgi:hypothetical protein